MNALMEILMVKERGTEQLWPFLSFVYSFIHSFTLSYFLIYIYSRVSFCNGSYYNDALL